MEADLNAEPPNPSSALAGALAALAFTELGSLSVLSAMLSRDACDDCCGWFCSDAEEFLLHCRVTAAISVMHCSRQSYSYRVSSRQVLHSYLAHSSSRRCTWEAAMDAAPRSAPAGSASFFVLPSEAAGLLPCEAATELLGFPKAASKGSSEVVPTVEEPLPWAPTTGFFGTIPAADFGRAAASMAPELWLPDCEAAAETPFGAAGGRAEALRTSGRAATVPIDNCGPPPTSAQSGPCSLGIVLHQSTAGGHRIRVQGEHRAAPSHTAVCCTR